MFFNPICRGVKKMNYSCYKQPRNPPTTPKSMNRTRKISMQDRCPSQFVEQEKRKRTDEVRIQETDQPLSITDKISSTKLYRMRRELSNSMKQNITALLGYVSKITKNGCCANITVRDDSNWRSWTTTMTTQKRRVLLDFLEEFWSLCRDENVLLDIIVHSFLYSKYCKGSCPSFKVTFDSTKKALGQDRSAIEYGDVRLLGVLESQKQKNFYTLGVFMYKEEAQLTKHISSDIE